VTRNKGEVSEKLRVGRAYIFKALAETNASFCQG
jgi:hypothetical protein